MHSLNGRMIFMFYSNINEVSVKASHIAFAFGWILGMARFASRDLPLHLALAESIDDY